MSDGMLKVYPSDLDGFDYYKNNSSMRDSQYIRRICRLDPPSQPMLAGTAFHMLMENRAQGKSDPIALYTEYGENSQGMKVTGVRRYGFEFKKDFEIPKAQLTEFRVRRMIEEGSEPALIAGRADGLTGNTLLEWKTTGRVNLEKYIDSWQWKTMLSCDDSYERLKYYIFQVRSKENQGRTVVDKEKKTVLYQDDVYVRFWI